MAIKFRCTHCHKLMSISSRKAGKLVTCPVCGEKTSVPLEDINEESLPLETEEKITENQDQYQNEIPPEDNDLPDKENSSPNPWDEINEDEENFTIRKADTEFDDMDLTPMVDVTFLLLIFFMITASFSLQKTIQIPKPDPDKQGAAQSTEMLEELLDESIQVDINEENQIFIDDEPLADINEIASQLSEKMLVDGKSELVVTAHAASLHENVILVIDAAKEVGMQKIRLATTSSDDE